MQEDKTNSILSKINQKTSSPIRQNNFVAGDRAKSLKPRIKYVTNDKQKNIKMGVVEQKNNDYFKNSETKIKKTTQHPAYKNYEKPINSEINKIQQIKESTKEEEQQQNSFLLKSLSQRISQLFNEKIQFNDEKKLMKFINNYFNYNHLFAGTQIINTSRAKKALIQKIQKFNKKNINKTKLVYRWDLLNMNYFKYLYDDDGLTDFVAIYQCQKASFCFFTKKICLHDDAQDSPAFLFSLKNSEYYYRNPNLNSQAKIKSSYWQAEKKYWTLGNSEIRFSKNTNQFRILDNTSNSYYRIGQPQNLTGWPHSTCIFKNLEIYKITFR